MQLAAVEYLNISGLVIFATSPVRTGNSFFGMFTSGHALSDGLLSAMTCGLANEQWATVNGVPSGFEQLSNDCRLSRPIYC